MDKLIEILKRIKPEVDFIGSKDLVYDGLLDSIDIVMILSEIERVYSIEIDPEEIDPDNFQSVSTMLEMINREISLKNGSQEKK